MFFFVTYAKIMPFGAGVEYRLICRANNLNQQFLEADIFMSWVDAAATYNCQGFLIRTIARDHFMWRTAALLGYNQAERTSHSIRTIIAHTICYICYMLDYNQWVCLFVRRLCVCAICLRSHFLLKCISHRFNELMCKPMQIFEHNMNYMICSASLVEWVPYRGECIAASRWNMSIVCLYMLGAGMRIWSAEIYIPLKRIIYWFL